MLLEKVASESSLLEIERQKEFEQTHKPSMRSGWPWTAKDVHAGVLERLYMIHLLESDPCIQRLRKDCNAQFSSLPELGRGSLLYNCLSVSTLEVMKEATVAFGASEDHSRAWLVGQTNHWISVLSARLPPLSSNQIRFETMVTDSRNNFVLSTTMEETAKVANYRMRRLVGDDMWTQLRRKLYIESLNDMPFSAELLHDCCTNRRDAAQHVITMHFDTFFNSYALHTNHFFDGDLGEEVYCPAAGLDQTVFKISNRTDSAPADWLPLFLHWLAEYYPAPVIEVNICAMLQKLSAANFSIPSALLGRLRAWRASVSTRLQTHFSKLADPSVLRLNEAWVHIDRVLTALEV